MKRFVATIVIFFILIIMSCLSLAFVITNEKVLESDLNEMIELAEQSNMSGAIEKASEFLKKWENLEQYMIMMVRHNMIDEITIRSSKLTTYAKYSNRGEFISEVKAIKTLLKHISDDEKPLLHNFL